MLFNINVDTRTANNSITDTRTVIISDIMTAADSVAHTKIVFNANAEKDEPTLSIPSATSSKIEIGVDLENINITDLINNVVGNPNIMDLVCSNSAKPVTQASIPARIESDNWPMQNTPVDIKTDEKNLERIDLEVIDYLSRMANMDNSASSVQPTAKPAMFFPPLPTKPLPTPAEMKKWLFDAEKDEPSSSVPSVTSSTIETRVDPENSNITDLNYSVFERKPTRPNRPTNWRRRIPRIQSLNLPTQLLISLICDDIKTGEIKKNQIEPLNDNSFSDNYGLGEDDNSGAQIPKYDNKKDVEPPRKIVKTRISRVTYTQPPAPVNEAVGLISNFTIFGDIDDISSSEEDETEIEQQPIPPTPVIEGLKSPDDVPSAVTAKQQVQPQSLPSSSPKRKRQDEVTESVKKPKMMSTPVVLSMEKEDEMDIEQQPTSPVELDNCAVLPQPKMIPSRLETDNSQCDPSMCVEEPRRIRRTRINRGTNQRPPALINGCYDSSINDGIFNTGSSGEDGIPPQQRQKKIKDPNTSNGEASQKRKRLTGTAGPNKKPKMMIIPDTLPVEKEDEIEIEQEPIPPVIEGLNNLSEDDSPALTVNQQQSLPSSSKRKRQAEEEEPSLRGSHHFEAEPRKKQKTQKNDDLIPAPAENIARQKSKTQVPDPEIIFRRAFENEAEQSKADLKKVTGLTMYRVNKLTEELCEKVDKTKRNSKYRLI